MVRAAQTFISSSSGSETSSPNPNDWMFEYSVFSLGSSIPTLETLTVTQMAEGKVAEYATTLDESRIRFLIRSYNLPSNAEMTVPRPEDRACAPPAGFVTIYEDSLHSGLRLPLPAPYAELQRRLRLPLGQIVPNAFRQFTDLGVAANRRNYEITAELIHELFAFKKSAGWYYASARTEFKGRPQNKVEGWHSKFFFCRHESLVDLSWRVGRLHRWESGEKSKEFEACVSALAKGGHFLEKYGEDSLAEAGLSPYEPQKMVDPATVRFTKRKGADSSGSAQESKKLKAGEIKLF